MSLRHASLSTSANKSLSRHTNCRGQVRFGRPKITMKKLSKILPRCGIQMCKYEESTNDVSIDSWKCMHRNFFHDKIQKWSEAFARSLVVSDNSIFSYDSLSHCHHKPVNDGNDCTGEMGISGPSHSLHQRTGFPPLSKIMVQRAAAVVGSAAGDIKWATFNWGSSALLLQTVKTGTPVVL